MDYTLLSCIDSRVESPMKFYGRFELGPFAPGQGLTVANSLRRSLLSQLTGTAIPLVEIAGASHEYETLGGVRESVLDILLNIKQIILTSDFEFFAPQIGFLSVKGPGVVRACDLKLPDFIYAVDPYQYIATLTTNGNLNMKFIIACGKNHITHSPGTSQYTDWVKLLKQTSSKSQNFGTIEHISNLNSTTNVIKKSSENSPLGQFDTKINSNLNLENKKNGSLETGFLFYQQWKNERLVPTSVQTQRSNEYEKNFNKEKFSKSEFNFKASNDPLYQLENGSLISKNEFPKIGYFTIDATFMPVTRVNYLIQASDDLQLAKDQIILEVWTNGSIHPRHAIHKAAKALIQLFIPLQQIKNAGLSLNKQTHLKLNDEQIPNSKTKQNNQYDPRILNLDIGNLDLTLSSYSVLKQNNINTITDLISYSKQQILEIPNFNQRWLNEVDEALSDLNLKFSLN